MAMALAEFCDGCGRPVSEAPIFWDNENGRFCLDCSRPARAMRAATKHATEEDPMLEIAQAEMDSYGRDQGLKQALTELLESHGYRLKSWSLTDSEKNEGDVVRAVGLKAERSLTFQQQQMFAGESE